MILQGNHVAVSLVAAQEFVQGARRRERMPLPMGRANLKYKIEIVRAIDWFTGGAQRHGTLRKNPRP